MKKFDGILICTDLDGTLLRDDKSVSRENRDAIEYFKAEGGRFTFITGRMPFFVSEALAATRPNAPIGCINGGGLYDQEAGKYLWTEELPRDSLILAEYIDRQLAGIGIQINTFDRVYFSKNNTAMERFRRITGLPNLVCRYQDVTDPMAKIVFGDEDPNAIARLAELLHAHPMAGRFDFIHSESTLYEIIPKGVHKGTVLPLLAAHLGIKPEKTIAVGDYYNDIGMIRAAGIGIAVSNARPEVKAAADHVTVSNEEHAIARIIADIEDGALRV